VDCKRVRAALSERMDGEHLSRHVADAVDRHLPGCAGCSSFEENAWRLRESVRFGVAAAVPDLVGPIMAAVRAESQTASPSRELRVLDRPAPTAPRKRRSLAPVLAAALAGMIVGSVVTGGFLSPKPPLAAADVVRGVTAAASRVQDYSASFAVTEYHFSPQIPVRRFSVDVAFSAPEQLRLDVVDHTIYPNPSWTPNDLSLVANGSRWSSVGPGTCASAEVTCPLTDTVVKDRSPFSSTSPLPTDLVVPVSTLGQAEGLTALERGLVAGRPAVRVELSYARAAPLFPYLRMGGDWRPYFPEDRVVLWLDARTYLPLRYSVFPSADPLRRVWERANGLPQESPAHPVLSASVVSYDRGRPPGGTFKVAAAAGAPRSEGAEALSSFASAQSAAGFQLVSPLDHAGLGFYRAALQKGVDAGSVLITYANGLAYLKVQESATWHGPAPYGGIDPQAEHVALPNGGVGLYEPATPTLGRRISIHAENLDVYLETNLPRRILLRVAASLPVRGEPLPDTWLVDGAGDRTTQVLPLATAMRELPFSALLPGQLPAGYDAASAQIDSVGGAHSLSVFYQQRSSDLAGGTLRIHEEEASALPPASSAHQSTVEVRGVRGRFTPDRHELEWVSDGVYVAIDGPGLELPELLSIAGSLR
jgi:hypothetical protein